MVTRRMRLRRQLRSARVSALTPAERRAALLAAEERLAARRGPGRADDTPASLPHPPARS